jgi:hypothetical protein
MNKFAAANLARRTLIEDVRGEANAVTAGSARSEVPMHPQQDPSRLMHFLRKEQSYE